MKKVDLIFNGKFHYYEISKALLKNNLLNIAYVNDKFFLNLSNKKLKNKIKFDYISFTLNMFIKIFGLKLNKFVHQNFPFNLKRNNNVYYYCASLCYFKLTNKNLDESNVIIDHGSPNLDYIKKVIIREMKKYSINIQNNLNAIVENWAIKQEDYEFNKCKKIIVASNFAKRTFLYKKYYDKIYVNNIVTNLDIKINHQKFEDKIKLIYVGDFSLWKGLHRMIFSLCEQKEFEVELNLVGGDLENHLLYKSIKNYINDNDKIKIISHGKLKKDKLHCLYKNMNLMIFPSLSDGYGIVVNEAISNGIPVICSIYSGAVDLIKKYKLGYSYDPYIKKSLISKLKLIRDRENYLEIIDNIIKFSLISDQIKSDYENNLISYIN